MTQPGDNEKDVLAEFLTGGSGLSCTYQKQAKDEPSTAIDEAIRAAAKREVKTGPGHIVNPFGRHWTVPASLAAMLLLSVGLVVFMSDETGVAPFSSEVLEEEVTERDLAQPAARQDRLADDKADSFMEPAAGRRSEEKVMRAKPAAPVSDSDARKRLKSESTGKTKQKSRVQREPAGVRTKPKLQKKVAPAKPKAVAPMMQMEMEAPAESADSNVLAPEVWLAQIKTLRAQGKTKEAEASLAEFRKVYPDYPLDSLRK